MKDPLVVSIHYRRHADRDPVLYEDIRKPAAFLPDDIDTHILVYADQVDGWFLQWGRYLLSPDKHNAGFVVLQIAIAQIEGIEQYWEGSDSKGDEPGFFKRGAKRILDLKDSSLTESILSALYSNCRCGLFHTGMTKVRIDIDRNYPKLLDLLDETVRINQNLLMEAVSSFFTNYVAELSDKRNVERRVCFEKTWKNMREIRP